MEGNPYRSPESPSQTSQYAGANTQRDRDLRMWAMVLHFSTLLGLTALPLLGLVAPVVIWKIKQEEFPELDVHGRAVVNWVISSVIYAAICLALVFLVVGIPLLFVLGAVCLIFPLVGGLKAHNGEVWKYPLSFPIL